MTLKATQHILSWASTATKQAQARFVELYERFKKECKEEGMDNEVDLMVAESLTRQADGGLRKNVKKKVCKCPDGYHDIFTKCRGY